MTAKEKAKELVDKFYQSQVAVLSKNGTAQWDLIEYEIAIKSALIAVDEIINHHSQEQGLYRIDTYYWQEVKKEIEKL